MGSLTGLGRALCHLGQEPILACPDPIPPSFDYVPGTDAIVQQVGGPFDLVVALDCSDRSRLGHLAQAPGVADVPLLNIDHHLTNVGFGEVNLVDPLASSTAEVVLRLLESMAIPIDSQAATSLLVGIVTDTRGFRTSNVTARAMEAALRLVEAGASLADVAREGLDRRPTSAIRLWGAALSQMQVEDRVIWTSVPLSMRREAGYEESGDAGLSSFLVGADEADVAAVFVEEPDGRIEVGFRAVPGFDVAQVALQFGGGGHALAAGCDLPGPLDEARTRVLAALWDSLSHHDPS